MLATPSLSRHPRQSRPHTPAPSLQFFRRHPSTPLGLLHRRSRRVALKRRTPVRAAEMQNPRSVPPCTAPHAAREGLARNLAPPRPGPDASLEGVPCCLAIRQRRADCLGRAAPSTSPAPSVLLLQLHPGSRSRPEAWPEGFDDGPRSRPAGAGRSSFLSAGCIGAASLLIVYLAFPARATHSRGGGKKWRRPARLGQAWPGWPGWLGGSDSVSPCACVVLGC